MNMSIKEIADACGGELRLHDSERSDKHVSSVVIDSRKLEAGGVFLATVGEKVDGHRFISQVFQAGACLAVTQKTPEQVQEETGIDCTRWGSYVLVEDTLEALKEIAEFYRRKLNIRIVGVTGSVGKTSTKEFIAGVLAEKLKVLKTEGNFNNEIGVPLTLLRIREFHEAAVVEMGISDFGEMHRLSKMVRPDICVITNIGQCHLENLKTREGILKAKSEIFDFMAPDGEVCLNGEDDKLRGLAEVKGHRPHFFGLGGNPAEEVVAGEIQSRGLWGSDAVLLFREPGENPTSAAANTAKSDANCPGNPEGVSGEGKGTELLIHVPLSGTHMVLNSAAAACVARLFGLSLQEIARGIAGIQPVSGRNNLVRRKRYTLIDDCYNANPASVKAAIDLLALADTQKVAILGDMFELGENSDALHAGVGEYAAAAGIDRILCVGDNSRHTFRAASDHAEGAAQITHFADRETLLKALGEKMEEYIPEGSTVLIKASHGMEFNRVLEFLKEQSEEC